MIGIWKKLSLISLLLPLFLSAESIASDQSEEALEISNTQPQLSQEEIDNDFLRVECKSHRDIMNLLCSEDLLQEPSQPCIDSLYLRFEGDESRWAILDLLSSKKLQLKPSQECIDRLYWRLASESEWKASCLLCDKKLQLMPSQECIDRIYLRYEGRYVWDIKSVLCSKETQLRPSQATVDRLFLSAREILHVLVRDDADLVLVPSQDAVDRAYIAEYAAGRERLLEILDPKTILLRPSRQALYTMTGYIAPSREYIEHLEHRHYPQAAAYFRLVNSKK